MSGYVYRGNEPFVPPTPAQIAARTAPPIKTHCIRNHPRTPENIDATNRACIQCRVDHARRVICCSVCGVEMQYWNFAKHRVRKSNDCQGATALAVDDE